VTPKRLREIREKHNLGNPEIARLVRVPVQPAVEANNEAGWHPRSEISRTVSDWLREKKPTPIPDSIAELLEAKVWLLENSNLSVQTLIDHDLAYCLALFRTKLKKAK